MTSWPNKGQAVHLDRLTRTYLNAAIFILRSWVSAVRPRFQLFVTKYMFSARTRTRT